MKKKYNLKVLTHRNYTPSTYSYDGIKVKCYDAVNLGFRLGIPYPIPNITSFKPFLEEVKSSTIIHAHGHPYLSSLIAAQLAKKYDKPFVLTQHNTFIQYDGMWKYIEEVNDLFVGKKNLQIADKIIAISNATRDYVLSLGANPSKIEVIYNGVDVERFKPAPTMRAEVRKKLGIPNDAIVVATVRRIVYKNGVDTLLECARIALSKNPRLIFLVMGKGPDFSEMQDRVRQFGMEKNFLLVGFVSDEHLPSYYNAADFFVLPSKSGEGLPLVALEAMACGLPIIATDVGGIGEVLIGGYGKLVAPRNPSEMSEAVLEFSQIKLKELSEKVRQKMVHQFSWDVNVEKLEKVYQEII
jgi:glycosyltransferase involved in cell wall biosynthesis